MSNTIIYLVNFYILMSILAEATTYDNISGELFLKSHEKFLRDLEEFFNEYTKSLSALLRDFVYSAALQEVLNEDCSNVKLEYENFSEVSEKELRRTLISAFREYIWVLEFGGEKWATIVEFTKIKNPVMFIDSIVDIEHNTGSIFSKEIPGSIVGGLNSLAQKELKLFLEDKFSMSADELIENYERCLSNETISFIKRFEALYKHKTVSYKSFKVVGRAIKKFYDYEPANFSGSSHINLKPVAISKRLALCYKLTKKEVENLNKKYLEDR